VTIHGKIFPADLVQLEIQEYDVILGMDWLVNHKETINYEIKLLTLATPEGEKMEYWGSNL